ncbi:cytochrome P450 [Nocardia flavorosea]|uniref:cytochrome P450 n=1 Tax=Nocardia flavorosea TaxID=53429 RepID=UPI001895E37B|nr:cytochrome P450 [Nocardia flavorosea]
MPDPASFDPDRWTPEYRKSVTRSGAFQPFGIGNRNCIGEPFAWLEATTILATVVARVRLEPVAGALPVCGEPPGPGCDDELVCPAR